MFNSFYFIVLTIIILVFLWGFVIYFLRRNNLVSEFLKELNDKAFYWSLKNPTEESAFIWFYDKLPQYDQMLFSFKPLKLEYWIDKETLRRIEK